MEKNRSLENYKGRSNLWICVGYPGESLPDDYINIIKNWHIPVLISPVHDADENADQTEKKKHVHIMLDFGSGQNKSFDQVRQYTNQLHGTIPVICHNRNAMIRYFIHKDNPEKHQYEIDDMISVSGFEFKDAFETYTSEMQIYKFIEGKIREKMIYNYAVLLTYLESTGCSYEANFVRKHTIHFRSFLDGQYQLIKAGTNYKMNDETGVIEYVEFKKDQLDQLKREQTE